MQSQVVLPEFAEVVKDQDVLESSEAVVHKEELH